MNVHCLFEQSGTFKKEFEKLGINALDYDIQNEFGETDKVVDLFNEIRGGYEGKPSIFDDMSQDDLIMAFFPCTRFENQIQMWFAGNNNSQKDWTDEQKLEYAMSIHKELSEYYDVLSKLCLISLNRKIKMVIENPYTQPHYLNLYWCLKPSIIDKDRTQDGDYFKKPTQYWFLGFEPHQNILLEPLQYVPKKTIQYLKKEDVGVKTQRSMIHPQYASRFIKKYLIDYETDIEKLFKGEY